MNLTELCDAYNGFTCCTGKTCPLITRSASTKRPDPLDTEDVLEAQRSKIRAERRF